MESASVVQREVMTDMMCAWCVHFGCGAQFDLTMVWASIVFVWQPLVADGHASIMSLWLHIEGNTWAVTAASKMTQSDLTLTGNCQT